MPTSLCALLGHSVDSATRSGPSESSADSAVAAIRHLARALDAAGQDSSPGNSVGPVVGSVRRQLAVEEIAKACRAAGAQWLAADNASVRSAAAAADLAAVIASRLRADERWVIATEIARAARPLAEHARRFGPYADAPALLRIVRLSAVVEQVNSIDPPDVGATGVLDALVPIPHGMACGAADLAAGLVHAVDTAMRHGEFSVSAALAAMAGAESAVEHASTVAASLAGPSAGAPPWTRAAASWRELQTMLRRFDDGSRYAAPRATKVTESALALHEAVSDLVGEGARPEVATAMRYLANQMPAIVGQIENAALVWSASGQLFARARALPLSDERATDAIHNRAVVVRPPEIVPVLLTARATRRLSTALAVELDRSAPVVGHQPQPNLIRALAATMAVDGPHRTEHWAGRALSLVAHRAPGL